MCMRAGLRPRILTLAVANTDEQFSELCRLACPMSYVSLGWVIDSVGF